MSVNNRVAVKSVMGIKLMSENNMEMVVVYRPKTNADGTFIIDSNNSAIVERVGGVKAGCKGIIVGPSIRVDRKCLIEYRDAPTSIGADLVHLFPIDFDDYTGVGYVCSDALMSI